MSTVHPISHPTGGRGHLDPGTRRTMREVWWTLASIPVAIVAATLLGSWLLMLLGVDPDADETPELWQALLAGLPATGVLLIPVLLALHLLQGHDERSARLVRIGVVLLGVWTLVPLAVTAIVAAFG